MKLKLHSLNAFSNLNLRIEFFCIFYSEAFQNVFEANHAGIPAVIASFLYFQTKSLTQMKSSKESASKTWLYNLYERK